MMPPPLTEQQRAAIAAYHPVASHVPAHWREETVHANGIRQHVWRTSGDKPAIVLLHGTMGSGLTWLRLARILERNYDVVMPDARGHGRSDGIATGFSPAILADDVAALFGALGLERAVVLGHSMGATSAAHLADRRPELVRAVVLEDPPWRRRGAVGSARPTDSPSYRAWLEQFTAWLADYSRRPFAEQAQAAPAHLPFDAATVPEEDYVAWIEALARYSPDCLADAARFWAEDSTVAAVVERITCPTLLLVGARQSPMSPYDQPADEDWPHLRVVRFPTGHFVHLEAFDTFVAAVTDLLSALP